MNKYKMTQKDNILFAKRNLVDSIYKEAKLEGIGVTFPDTYEIFNGRTVAGLSVDDTIKINNLKHAWEVLTMENKKLWYAILRDEEDNDLGSGSFDKDEAISMAKAQNFKRIAVVDADYDDEGNETTDTLCIEIITETLEEPKGRSI